MPPNLWSTTLHHASVELVDSRLEDPVSWWLQSPDSSFACLKLPFAVGEVANFFFSFKNSSVCHRLPDKILFAHLQNLSSMSLTPRLVQVSHPILSPKGYLFRRPLDA
jgi:hypothetical protein